MTGLPLLVWRLAVTVAVATVTRAGLPIPAYACDPSRPVRAGR